MVMPDHVHTIIELGAWPNACEGFAFTETLYGA